MKTTRVFELKIDGYIYAINGKNELNAIENLSELIDANFKDIEAVKEIPESEWDKKTIKMHEDNDKDNKPFYISIREELNYAYPSIIYTNDPSYLE